MKKRTEIAKLMQIVRNYPSVRAMAARDNFQTSTTVQTNLLGDKLDHASSYALGNQMQGKARRRCRVADDLIWWDFEYEEDAILFMLKYGGRGIGSQPLQ